MERFENERFQEFFQAFYEDQAERMNANFAVFFDEVDGKFYYYVERLVGVEVEFE